MLIHTRIYVIDAQDYGSQGAKIEFRKILRAQGFIIDSEPTHALKNDKIGFHDGNFAELFLFVYFL